MIRQLRSSEGGAALMWVAGSMVMLLAMAALAVDLGWYYLNSSRLQRATDAAALAGVVNLPADSAQAYTDARSAATANGFATASVTGRVLADNKYQVTLDTTVPTFFAQVVGITSLPIERTSTAEYTKPLRMGSPYASFGYGYDSNQSFWAAIQAPYTSKNHGDPYATRCGATASNGSCGSSNASYRSAGYYYGIEIPTGTSSFTVQLYDAGSYDRSNFAETGDEHNLGSSGTGGGTANFQLYRVDTSPLDPTDNPSISGCGLSVAPGASAGTYQNRWANLCSLSGTPDPGIYVLRVWSTGNGGGTNHYAIRATSTGSGTPKVYGINDMSIFTNDAGGTGTATVHLAELTSIHAGKRLELRFFDPGEGSGNAYMTVKRPDGSTPSCTWEATNDAGTQTDSGSGTCRIQTTVNDAARFNGQWVTVTISVPDTYTCSSNCWWKVELDLNRPHDRTTWEARVIGSPVRLVPNP
jgi:hypothetical protein